MGDWRALLPSPLPFTLWRTTDHPYTLSLYLLGRSVGEARGCGGGGEREQSSSISRFLGNSGALSALKQIVHISSSLERLFHSVIFLFCDGYILLQSGSNRFLYVEVDRSVADVTLFRQKFSISFCLDKCCSSDLFIKKCCSSDFLRKKYCSSNFLGKKCCNNHFLWTYVLYSSVLFLFLMAGVLQFRLF